MYDIPRSLYQTERQRLAGIAQEVLLSHGYFPEQVRNLSDPGERGRLVSAWNDRDAREPIYKSFEGTRRKVYLEVREDLSDLVRQPRTEEEARLMIATQEPTLGDRVRIAVGLACAEEVNTRMNIQEGDYQNADWRWEGWSLEWASRLNREIRDLYYERSRGGRPSEGALSPEMEEALRTYYGTEDGEGDQDDPDAADEERDAGSSNGGSESGIYGPGTSSGPSGDYTPPQ